MSLASKAGVALALLLVPLMLLAPALPPSKFEPAERKQNLVLALTVAVAIASGTGCFVRRWRSTLAMIVLGTSLLLIATIAWNRSYRSYCASNLDYRREVFRRAMRNSFHWPLYGRYDNAIARWDGGREGYDFSTLPFAFVSLAVAGGWLCWAIRRPLERRWDTRSLAVLMAFQLALIVAFALCEPWPSRLSLRISGYNEFKKDLTAFDGIADILHSYVGRMPKLEWYGQHYPPGNLVLIGLEKSLGVPGMAKSVVCLAVVLTLIPLSKLARDLDLNDAATSACLLLFAASTSILVYCTINTTSLLLLPGTMCLWLLVRALRTGAAGPAIGLGAWFTVYLLLSFSASILGLLMGLIALIGWSRGQFSKRHVLRAGVVSLCTVAALILLIWAACGFNLVACFHTAVRGHQTQQGNEGFDDLRRYLLRSTGNVLAYAMSIVPLSVLACSTMLDRRNPLVRTVAIAGVFGVLVAGFSGLFYLETERIWIFMTPAFALATGHALTGRSPGDDRRLVGLVFGMALLISCSQELLFLHYR